MTGSPEKSGFIDTANQSLSKFLPEQTMTIRSRAEKREITFSPLGRLTGFIGGTLAVGWLIVATSATVSSYFESDSAEARSLALQDAYELRLAELATERDDFAIQAQATQNRFNLALTQVSAQQDELIAAMTVQNEQQITLFALQRQLNSATAERNAAQSSLDGLQTEFAQMSEGNGPRDSSETELTNTLLSMNDALSGAVQDRDMAIAEINNLEESIDLTAQQIRLDAQRRDRMITQLEEAVQVSLSPLETMFRRAGLDVDSLIANIRRNYSGSGGLGHTALSDPSIEGVDAQDLRLLALMDSLDTVQIYNIAASQIPFTMPVRTAIRHTSGFGYRDGREHKGTDMAGPVGTPIYTTADGYVTFAGRQSGYGNLIIIQHDFGFETRYAHLSRISITKGDRVSRGDRIGDMGNTGRSSGSHLHYEIRTNGEAVNPMTYIRAGQNVY